ncbi:MAG: ThiF family adenylyltransferase, partial [Pseudomonadota bacterium]
MTHSIPRAMTERAWRIAVVGAGGTGSAVIPSLARLHHAMLELGHPGGIDCVVYDDDTVSESNVGRQGFYPADVGRHKAALLVNRLNVLMG